MDCSALLDELFRTSGAADGPSRRPSEDASSPRPRSPLKDLRKIRVVDGKSGKDVLNSGKLIKILGSCLIFRKVSAILGSSSNYFEYRETDEKSGNIAQISN